MDQFAGKSNAPNVHYSKIDNPMWIFHFSKKNNSAKILFTQKLT